MSDFKNSTEKELASATDFLLAIERIQRMLRKRLASMRKKYQKNPNDEIACQNFLDASADASSLNQLLITANKLGQQVVMLSGLLKSLGASDFDYADTTEDPKKDGFN